MTREELEKAADRYIERLLDEFEQRVRSWNLDLSHEETFIVAEGILCRQLGLCISIARDVDMWNWDFGFMILRLMSGLCIDFAWISLNPQERSIAFIEYGEGQALLDLEHKRIFAQQGDVSKESLDTAENWFSDQRREIFTSVNLASWSGLTVSKMAEEAGTIDIYEGTYAPASSALHSNWYHLSRYYLRRTADDQDGWIPSYRSSNRIYPDVFSLATYLMERTFEIADKVFPGPHIPETSARKQFIAECPPSPDKKQ